MRVLGSRGGVQPHCCVCNPTAVSANPTAVYKPHCCVCKSHFSVCKSHCCVCDPIAVCAAPPRKVCKPHCCVCKPHCCVSPICVCANSPCCVCKPHCCVYNPSPRGVHPLPPQVSGPLGARAELGERSRPRSSTGAAGWVPGWGLPRPGSPQSLQAVRRGRREAGRDPLGVLTPTACLLPPLLRSPVRGCPQPRGQTAQGEPPTTPSPRAFSPPPKVRPQPGALARPGRGPRAGRVPPDPGGIAAAAPRTPRARLPQASYLSN